VGASVVGELHERNEFCPIILLEVAKDPEVLFQLLVNSLGLSISLWMIRSAEGRFDVQLLPQFLDNFGCKLGATVGDYLLRESGSSPDIVKD